MASNSTISISFSVKEGRDGLKELTMDAKGLQDVMKQNVEVAKSMQDKIFKFAATATGIKATAGSFEQLTSVLQNLTSESESFTKAMKAANTMAGKDNAGFRQLKDDVAVGELRLKISLAVDEESGGALPGLFVRGFIKIM